MEYLFHIDTKNVPIDNYSDEELTKRQPSHWPSE